MNNKKYAENEARKLLKKSNFEYKKKTGSDIYSVIARIAFDAMKNITPVVATFKSRQ